MRVTVVNPVWRPDLGTPSETLDAFPTLTGWAGALHAAGAGHVTVVQRFNATATTERAGVHYAFLADGDAADPHLWNRGGADLHRVIQATDADLVHVNGVMHPELLCRLRTTLPARTAVVVQDHGGLDLRTTRPLVRRSIRRGLGRADALLVAARGQDAIWRETGAAPTSTPIIDVMESSTPLRPVERDDARRSCGLTGSPALLCVGRLTTNKDPLTILTGVARFFARHNGAHLTMVYQDATLEHDVRAMIASMPALHGRVHLRGAVAHAELAAYFSAADLFVSGSHAEGSGYAAIEAIACGTVPVLTDIPSFRALTREGAIGALWTAGDAAALDAALERAWYPPLETAREQARAWFRQSFSWDAIGRRAVEIYAALIRVRQSSHVRT